MTASIPALLQPLKDRLAAATPGPWRAHDTWIESGGYCGTVMVGNGNDTELLAWLPTFSHEPGERARNVIPNARLMAHAPMDQAKLIAAIEGVAALHHEDLFRGHLSNGCKVCGHDWPCATYTALTQALGGDTA